MGSAYFEPAALCAGVASTNWLHESEAVPPAAGLSGHIGDGPGHHRPLVATPNDHAGNFRLCEVERQCGGATAFVTMRSHGTAPGPLTSGALAAEDRSNHLAVRPQPCERQRGGDEQQRVQRGDASTNVVLSGLDGAATLSEREHHCRHAATSNPASTPGAAGDRCPHRQIGRRSGRPAPRHDAATPRDRPNETSSRLLAPGTDVS